MLGSCQIIAFIGSTDAARAREFYGEKLGLRLVSEELPFALVYDAHGTMLRVSMVDKVAAAPYTVLGWDVPDIKAAVAALQTAGVNFQRFNGMGQDKRGVWAAPGGAKLAWFKDPDGNLLSITQF